jgi:excisionase family DNA binding protein
MPSTAPGSGPRFLQLADVAETLNISAAQVYALVRSGDLPAIKIGGRGQWRVEATELEAYIARMYDQTREFVQTHRFGRSDELDPDGPDGPDGPDAVA